MQDLILKVSGATIQGQIDLFADEQIDINYSISSIKNITEKKTPTSKDFSVPGNANNNKLFSQIFEINTDSTFDPRKKAVAQLTYNSIPIIEKGIMQLLSIDIDEEKIPIYNIIVYEESQTFIDSLNNKYLTDLNFNELTHKFEYSAITNSWTATTNTYTNDSYFPYYYGFIDYGYYWSLADLQGSGATSEQFYPATSEKYILDKIFSAAGYTYQSNFLTNDSGFTNNYIPFNGITDLLLDNSFATARTFHAGCYFNDTIPASDFPVGSGIWSDNYGVGYYNDSTSGNFDNGNLYDGVGTFDPLYGNLGGGGLSVPINKYSADTKMALQFACQVKVTASVISLNQVVCCFHRSSLSAATTSTPWLPGYSTIPGSFGTPTVYNNVFCRVDNSSVSIAGGVYYFETPPLNNPSSQTYYPAQPGETFWVTFKLNVTNGSSLGSIVVHSGDSYFWNTVLTNRYSGQTVTYNSYIPKQIKQTDFIDSLCKKYNLFIEPAKDNNKALIIEPRDEYYTATLDSNGNTIPAAIKDWSQKIDLSKGYSQQLLSEQQNKQIRFKYKEDSDYLNDHYQVIENRTFGDYLQIFDNDFAVDSNDIEIIYSPTPLINIRNTSDFVVPLISKIDASGNYGLTDFNLRVLQKNMGGPIPGMVALATGENWKLDGHTISTGYPYIGHLDHPINSTSDLNFGQIQYCYYNLTAITNNNLVNKYWINTLNEINDKNSYLLTAYFYLTANDINNIRYNDNIYLSGLTNTGGAYYKINSIDYTANNSIPSKVELIKSLVTPAAIDFAYGSSSLAVPAHIFHREIQTGSGNFGSNQVFTNSSLAIGTNNLIAQNSPGSFVTGNLNTLNANISNSTILGGNNNSILVPGNTIIGGSFNSIIEGSGNTIIGGSQTVFSGSNQTVVSNITVLSSITIGNTIINVTGGTLGLWSASTGTNSIIANNGTGNLASGNYTLVVGQGNTASGNYGVVVGGSSNLASNNFSSVFGGLLNRATDVASSVFGGGSNSATTPYSFILGGRQNIASGYCSVILSGYKNKTIGAYSIASGYKSLASGGTSNAFGSYSNAAGPGSSVLGGYGNIVAATGILNKDGTNSVIAGGQTNYIVGDNSFIGAGSANKALNKQTFIGAGFLNTASTGYAVVINGGSNISSGGYSFIGNGINNRATGGRAFIGTGSGNFASATDSWVGGGGLNSATTTSATILNGSRNTASGSYSFVSNGYKNKSSASHTIVIGGNANSATTNYSSVIAGASNLASGGYSFIGNGRVNTSSQGSASIINGFTNLASSSYALIGNGSQNSASTLAYSTVMNGKNNWALGKYSFIANGLSNKASAAFSSVLAGKTNNVSGQSSAIVAGSGHTLTGNLSAILAGSGITASANDSAYVPDLRVQSSHGIYIATGGTSATAGLATLVAGTVVVSTKKVTASSLIFLTIDGGVLTNIGTAYVSARTAGTSFTITSTNVLDASNVGWFIVEPF